MIQFLAAASLVFAQSTNPAPEALKSSGQWVVNFADAQCIATRDYQAPEGTITLVLKAPPAGDVLEVAVMHPDRRGWDPKQYEGTVDFGGAGTKPVSVLAYPTSDKKQFFYLYNLPREEARAGLKRGPLTLTAGRELQVRFQLSGVESLMKVMDDCVADLRKHWNVRENENAPQLVKRPARASLIDLFNWRDYPGLASRDDLQGTVGAVILVDEKGKVADCTLIQTSGVASLDSQTCFVIRSRGRYKPAVGFDGKPAKDVDYARIRWVMP